MKQARRPINKTHLNKQSRVLYRDRGHVLDGEVKELSPSADFVRLTHKQWVANHKNTIIEIFPTNNKPKGEARPRASF